MRVILAAFGFDLWYDAKDLGGPIPAHLQGTFTTANTTPVRAPRAYETPRTQENI